MDLIELHDSVAELRRDGSSVIIDLRPAYVHHWEKRGGGWTGTGRSQEARIKIGCRAEVSVPFGPLEVSAGSIRIAGSQLGLIPAPMNDTGPVTAQLEFVDGSSVAVDGTGVEIELLGEAEDIEALPPEWAPTVDAV
jgi:hypothetical protein